MIMFILTGGVMPAAAAGSFFIMKGSLGPTTVTTPYQGVINKGTVNGGSSAGLTVTGTAAQKVINYGTITGTTGLSVSGSGKIVNNGTILGISTGVAVGRSQIP